MLNSFIEIIVPANKEKAALNYLKYLKYASVKVVKSNTLSPRQRVIITSILKGKTYTEIAKELNISLSGVEWHRQHIFKKFKLENNTDLLAYAFRQKLIEQKKRPAKNLPVLTAKEKLNLTLLAKGFTINQVAKKRKISESAVSLSMQQVYSRTGNTVSCRCSFFSYKIA